MFPTAASKKSFGSELSSNALARTFESGYSMEWTPKVIQRNG
jgi:hypothetical protein